MRTKILPLFYLLFFIFGSTQLFADESKWALFCPDDVTIDCDDEIWDLSIYGWATIHDYSGYHPAGQPIVNYYLNECGVGFITRTWIEEDYNWNFHTCTQTITVGASGAFGWSNIHWPPDLEADACEYGGGTDPEDLPPPYNHPTFDNVDCAMPAWSYDDQVFVFNDGCTKILRTWTVIDCCQYNHNSGGYGGSSGIWEYTQIIKITVKEIPTIECPPDMTVNATSCNYTWVDIPMAWAMGDCDLPVDVTNNSPWAAYGGADASGNYPVGTYWIMFTAEQGCGKIAQCKMKLTVLNNLPPVPYCHHGLAVALMPVDEDGDGIPEDGMVEIWASDFDAGSYHPCYNTEIIFSFSSNIYETSRVYTCADVGINEVEMWVTDAKTGYQTYCLTYVIIQNNNANIPNCEPAPPVDTAVAMAGALQVHTDLEGVGQTEVRLTAINAGTAIVENEEMIITESIDTLIQNGDTLIVVNADTTFYVSIDTILVDVTDTLMTEDGDFLFSPLVIGMEYDLSAHKEDETADRITIDDAIALLKHLQNIEELKSPYQLLAADFDGDEKLTNEDFFAIHNLINGLDTSDTAPKPYWEFIPEYYNFINPDSPYTEVYPLAVHLDSFPGGLVGSDFIGVKKGDIVKVHEEGEGGEGGEHRLSAPIALQFEDIFMETGNTYDVNFTTPDGEWTGYDLFLAYDASEIEILNTDLTEYGVSFAYQGGHLIGNFDEDQNDFSITIFAAKSGLLSDILSEDNLKNSRIYYGENKDVDSRQLTVSPKVTDIDAPVVSPNPFMNTSTLTFGLERAQEVQVLAYNSQGEEIMNQKVEGVRGANQMEIGTDALNTNGLIFITIRTETNTLSTKAIILQ
jgi:hypothetical protein